MSDQEVEFDVAWKLQGCTVEFRYGGSARVSERRLKQKLFRETRTGIVFDAEQMLQGYYEQSKTTPESYVGPPELKQAFEEGVFRVTPDLAITFTSGVFSFRANSGLTEIARIVFDVEFTVRLIPDGIQ